MPAVLVRFEDGMVLVGLHTTNMLHLAPIPSIFRAVPRGARCIDIACPLHRYCARRGWKERGKGKRGARCRRAREARLRWQSSWRELRGRRPMSVICRRMPMVLFAGRWCYLTGQSKNDTQNDKNDTQNDKKDTQNDKHDTKNDTKNDKHDTQNDKNDGRCCYLPADGAMMSNE